MSEESIEAVDNPEISVNPDQVTEPIAAPDAKWYENLDADLKSHPSIQKFNDPGKLAKSYVELEKMVGKEKVVLPNEKSTPEELSDFYNKMGRPEEFSKYTTPDIEIDNPDLKMQDHTLEAFKQKAHELGLTDKQFAELYGFQHEQTLNTYNNHLEQSIKDRGKSEAQLRQEWGNAYDSRVDGAQQVVNTFFKDVAKDPSFERMANSPDFIKAMSKISESLGEDVITGGARMTKTPAEAQSELNAIITDKSHPFHDNTNPEHAAAVDKFLSLQTAASAG